MTAGRRTAATLALALATLVVLAAGARGASPSTAVRTASCRASGHGRCAVSHSRHRRHRARSRQPHPAAPRHPSPVVATVPVSPPAGSLPVPAPPAAVAGPGTPPATPGSPPVPAAPAHVQVTAKEFDFTLSRPTVVAGPLVVQFVNAGQDPHNLHVQPAGGGADIGAFGLGQPGARTNQTFTLAPGSYLFYCSLPGHQAAGMSATLIVQ